MSTILYRVNDEVELLIGQEKHSVLASKTALLNWSPVFNAMLKGNFAEAQESAVIQLPADDVEAMLYLLRMRTRRYRSYLKN